MTEIPLTTDEMRSNSRGLSRTGGYPERMAKCQAKDCPNEATTIRDGHSFQLDLTVQLCADCAAGGQLKGLDYTKDDPTPLSPG